MEIQPDKYRAVVFDLDGTLYDNKGLPLKLVLADIPNMWVLGAERKARKLIKGADYGDAAGVYDALFAKMAEVKRSLTVERPVAGTKISICRCRLLCCTCILLRGHWSSSCSRPSRPVA